MYSGKFYGNALETIDEELEQTELSIPSRTQLEDEQDSRTAFSLATSVIANIQQNKNPKGGPSYISRTSRLNIIANQGANISFFSILLLKG